MNEVIPGELVIEGEIKSDRPARIWKHPLSLNRSPNRIMMPKGARILTVEAQRDYGHMWELHDVDMENEMVERTFKIVGTGHTFDSAPTMYVGTYQTEGLWVWHVFEVSNG